jgi:DNA-binding NarL/FixJ family response regulator
VTKAEAHPAEVASDLAIGREHYANHRWADAYEALGRADRAAALEPPDLQLFAWSAGLSGHDEEQLKLSERVCGLYAEAGSSTAAALWAFWTGFRLYGMGELGRASGWLARSRRFVEQSGEESVVSGYLLIPSIRQHIASGDHDAAFRVATDAVGIGERFGEEDLVAFARNLQARVRIRQDRFDEGIALLDEVMLGVTAGELSPPVTGILYCAAIEACHLAYAFDRAREWTNAFAAWCEKQPQLAPFAATCLVHRAEILSLGGEWSEALEEARRACRLPATRVQPAAGEAFYQEAEVHRMRGEHAAAEEAYRRANDHGKDPQPGLALLRLAQGRSDAAATAIRRVVDGASSALERAKLLPAFVEISLAAGDLEGARAACEELSTIAASRDVDVLAAMACHARGQVHLAEGDARAALPLLRRAFEVWQRIGAPYIAARLRVALARAFCALGDDDGAELELSAARQVFERLGAAGDLRAIDRDDAPESTERHGLTMRELEVLRLLATGKTNKAISVELCLSEKTVDRHVSNIFVKADVASRAAATAFAYEHGIVRPVKPPRG